ncbi:SelT/SelW/SelH family protein [Nocardiopsis sp. MG754419]|uniref:SelT/SelW/SelH family protein n=1 Tax=Nocardiopsis sp. MG754419 TaxID=2259865 RepID=UPI0027DDFD35|nr:SelT/SelW/SelH family protein [Nocardiopsis sp. MG754419]MBR8740632.1 selenoprotein W-related protein [Nocardiopsis sp. MG754419]
MSNQVRSPRLEIEYCTRCRWLPRATWMAQELLTTFEAELGEVALVPGTGGVFEVRLDGAPVWSRKSDAAFTDAADLKRLIRDRIAPERSLGHSDHRN